jgi:hypothetical protein
MRRETLAVKPRNQLSVSRRPSRRVACYGFMKAARSQARRDRFLLDPVRSGPDDWPRLTVVALRKLRLRGQSGGRGKIASAASSRQTASARWKGKSTLRKQADIFSVVGGGEIGLEGDLAWTNSHGARPCPIGFFANCEIDTNWLSTVTSRIGYAYWNRLLAYVKGGAAIAARHRGGSLQSRDTINNLACSRLSLSARNQDQGRLDDRGRSRIWSDAKRVGQKRIDVLSGAWRPLHHRKPFV